MNWKQTNSGTFRCLLYTSDAADDLLCVDLGGRRIIKKTADQVKSIYHSAKNLEIDVIFGGLGIDLLPGIYDSVDKTFITYKELTDLI